MARLQVELDRLADPTAWPDRCARCGAHGTTLVPVPDNYAKGQAGWRMPLCAPHAGDWRDVRRKNRVGMVAILIGMATAAAITWTVHPRFVAVPDDASRFLASFMVGFLTVLPLGAILAMWAKTPIRIEKVEGRFASIIGLGRAFRAAAAETAVPVPLPEPGEDVRFDAEPYAPQPTAAPEAVGLLFAASVLLGAGLGFVVGLLGPEIRDRVGDWRTNDYRYCLLVAATAAVVLTVGVFGIRGVTSGVGLTVLAATFLVAGAASVLFKWFGFLSSWQFALAFTGAPLLALHLLVLHPIIWNQRIRHPALAGLVSAVGPLAYAGVVYVVAGLADGPQLFALGVGPVFALVLAGTNAATARLPYCGECSAWLASRRLGAVARTRPEVERLLAEGAIVSLSAAKTYPGTASLGDVELTAYSCPTCAEKGTVVLELHECRPVGKHNSPTLVRVGRWQYPGHATVVVNAIFPPPPEEAAQPRGEDGAA